LHLSQQDLSSEVTGENRRRIAQSIYVGRRRGNKYPKEDQSI
jgi:hypothetical protein